MHHQSEIKKLKEMLSLEKARRKHSQKVGEDEDEGEEEEEENSGSNQSRSSFSKKRQIEECSEQKKEQNKRQKSQTDDEAGKKELISSFSSSPSSFPPPSSSSSIFPITTQIKRGKPNPTTGLIGVYKKGENYKVNTTINGIKYDFGAFKTKKEAGIAHDRFLNI